MTKDVVAKNWSITPSADGIRWSVFPLGDKPIGAPFILFTNINAGPTAGNVTGGGEEGGKGCYLAVFMLNAGTFSDWGVNNHLTIGGVEVDNYRGLVAPLNPKLAAMGVKVLLVQVGSLGAAAAGSVLSIAATVRGQALSNSKPATNYLDIAGDALTFTVQPGPMIYIDPVNGNNANAGTFAAPKKDLQDSTGQAAAVKIATTANGTNGSVPGTHFILMPTGTYSTSGVNNRVVDLFRVTGLPPTGAVNRGPIVFMSYPGAVGSNSFTPAYILAPSGKGGCFNGNDSTRAFETSTAYGGFTGYCQDIHVSLIKMEASAFSGGDMSPFNTQNRMQRPRIVCCEMIWKSTITGFSTQPRSAGIEGSPTFGRILGNYIHDIYGSSAAGDEADTNHAMYFDGFGSGATGDIAHDNVILLNYATNITAGNGFQFYDGANGAGMHDNTVAYNWIKTVHKHGINCSNNNKSLTAYNNIVEDCGEDGFHEQSGMLTGTNALQVFNNVFRGWGRTTTLRGAFNQTTASTGTGTFANNICEQVAGMQSGTFFFARASSAISASKNCWYDESGALTSAPAEDTTGIASNPLFTSAANGDYTLQDGSPCINAGSTPPTTRSYGFGLNTAPQGAAHDMGAYERA